MTRQPPSPESVEKAQAWSQQTCPHDGDPWLTSECDLCVALLIDAERAAARSEVDGERSRLVSDLADYRARWIAACQRIEEVKQDHAEQLLRAKAEGMEEAAKVCERRREARFEEHGYTEPDTNASYYTGPSAEQYEARDEEDDDCARAIRARAKDAAK